MLLFTSFALPVAFSAAAVAAQSNSIVCVAGQCLQGSTNTSVGATLNVPSNPPIILLPGQYSSTTQPDLLHEALSSSQTKLSLSAGFSNSTSPSSSSTPSLPLTVALQPGVLSFQSARYNGQSTFTQLPSSANQSSSTIPSGSFMVGQNTWAALASSNSRIILWDSVPDFAQLPSINSASSFTLSDIQSSACSTPCASSGVCSASGQCTCASGFTGTSCETCAKGFFGPSCQACPSNCATCDEGLTGSGKCLVPQVSNPPSSCNCLNGQCGSGGSCTCNAGWTTAANGTQCAKCSDGFFQDSNGDCSVCQLSCTQCADGTGECTACKSGFTQNQNDKTKCIESTTTSSTTNSTQCPDGSFNNGGSCTLCSPSCKTCTGATSNDCIQCASGQFAFNGGCVGTDANGVCSGTNLIANNVKEECDSCPAKCTSCKIANFNAASTINQAQCTGCLPGFVLSNGQCTAACPSGTFLGSDNLTCQQCDSTCSSCVGNSKFCLTCANNQLALNGSCTTSCPSNTFSSSGACLACHPDCATCTGGNFNQCATCPSGRPVLSSGRCLPTCSKSQFFDTASNSCKSCDTSCSSCSGSGSNACLACADSSKVLQGGSCVDSKCTAGTSVVPGLGVCLSSLVAVADTSSTTSPTLPTFVPPPTATKRPLAWWEILLMALGCAFIFMVFLWLWRRRMRKQRAKKTALFAQKIQGAALRRPWYAKFRELLKFKRPEPLYVPETEYSKLMRLREEDNARHEMEMRKLQSSIASRSILSRQPSLDRSVAARGHSHSRGPSSVSGPSLYSQITGVPRRTAEPRQPTHDLVDVDLERGPVHEPPERDPYEQLIPSRFSITTRDTASLYAKPEVLKPLPTVAQEYAAVHKTADPWVIPSSTGASGSKNPFRR